MITLSLPLLEGAGAGYRISVPPQVLTCSGSKGMISACKGTPKDIRLQR